MRHRGLIGAALVGMVGFAWVRTANGQEQGGYFQAMVPAAADAFELRVGTGYTQGFGMIAPGQSIPNTAGAGIGASIDADYRITPHSSIGVQVEYQEFINELNTSARGLAANLGITVHGAPFSRGDPWLRLASGYRLLWSVNPPGLPTTMLNGFELGKVTLGYDLRFSRDVALAPVIGADLNLFVWQDQDGMNTSLSSAQVGMFVFAGLQARFDMGGRSYGLVPVATTR
jgi:hypothetical protein